MTHFKVYALSFISTASMEVLKHYNDIASLILQLIIGVLTIIYLIKKIRK